MITITTKMRNMIMTSLIMTIITMIPTRMAIGVIKILQILTSMVKIILVAMKRESKTNQGSAIQMVRRTY